MLGELGVNLGPLIAAAGIAGVALGFGAQSLVKDFLAGIFILVEDQYGVGDIIDIGEVSGTLVTGTVEGVSLRATRLRSTNGTVWHVPNGTILRVGNMSQQWARALLDVSVVYGSDLDQAQAVIKRAADELWQDPAWSDEVLEEPELWGVENLAPEGVTIRLVVKTQPAEQFRVLRELRARIKAALDAVGVDLSSTQRTLVMQRDPASPAAPVDEDPGWARSGLRCEGDRDGEGVTDLGVEVRDDARGREVVDHQREGRESLGGVGDDDALDRRPHRAPALGLRSAQLGEHVGGHPEGERVGVGGRRPQWPGVGPGGAMDRAGLPPRPHLFGDVGQERREQLQERVEGETEGGLG